MPDEVAADAKAEELAAIVREIRERVRERYPAAGAAGKVRLPLVDLMPVLHARDAAEGKVAAIGTVNPRPPGLLNDVIQFFKRLVARLLEWHVREQVEFNRAVLAGLDAILEALNEYNRSLARVAAVLDGFQWLEDARSQWNAWRAEFERKLAANELQLLRAVAELQGAFQHRTTLMETNFRDLVRGQHKEFVAELERSTLEVQKRLWSDLEKVRLEFERLIHAELRLIRQRTLVAPRPEAAAELRPTPPADFGLDWLKFSQRFRGDEDFVRHQQRFYVQYFQGCQAVADLGCGRGEFLELLAEAGIPARGVDSNAEAVAICRSKGLQAEAADLFEWLRVQPDSAFDGIFCAQVIEHLPPERVPELLRLAASKLARGGRLVIETPNPECLAIFASHYYLDPGHRHPIPPALLVFYFEEAGFGDLRVERRSPAWEQIPALASLPEDFRQALFGGMDYAVIGRRLG